MILVLRSYVHAPLTQSAYSLQILEFMVFSHLLCYMESAMGSVLLCH